MNFTAALLSPLLLLLHGAGYAEADMQQNRPMMEPAGADASDVARVWPEPVLADRAPDWPGSFASRSFLPEPAWQVRIEQRMIIRIAPRAPGRTHADMFAGLPPEETGMRFSERKIGKCLAIAGIAGVQPDRNNRLLLYMRDRRIVSAELERSCRARDFYSGFYLANSSDGRLCVDRDTLQSRAGANCKLARIRQLVPED